MTLVVRLLEKQDSIKTFESASADSKVNDKKESISLDGWSERPANTDGILPGDAENPEQSRHSIPNGLSLFDWLKKGP
jgi:hypothetical protein